MKKKKLPAKKTATPAEAGVVKKLTEPKNPDAYLPSKVQSKIGSYVRRRIAEMQDYRKGLKIESRWKEADEEYVPHELDFGTTRKRFETDQDTGLRSKMVPVGDAAQQWRQASSAPTLLAKIQTAISIIIDRQPEAELVALLKRYEATTDVAYALWKRNWQITDAKEKLKLNVFNLFKYGWAPQRTYPRLVKYQKRIRVEVDPENPENDKYEERENVWFNDIDRQPLDVHRTWIDELSRPYDPYSTNEAYFELDYSFDAFKTEFSNYPNFKSVPRNSYMPRNDEDGKQRVGGAARERSNEEMKMRQDIVTVGFFESRHKDLFVIYIPKSGIVLYNSPMPNDDGYLSITHTLYLLRHSTSPYGISLWEVIRQNKGLYDKMKNMTMDQLVLSIMKFGFFTGTSAHIGDGKVPIVPGQARQLTSSTGKPEVNWMEIPGPGEEAWKGMEALQAMMDDESGISPTLEGEVTGKTLGEILHAKEAALKRMKTPLDNIAWLIEQDAYLTLSWMSQVYAIPTVKKFTTMDEMRAYEKENQVNREDLFVKQNEDGSYETDDTGNLINIEATYLPELSLHLEDRDGKMVKSKKSKFYQLGKKAGQLNPASIKWRGIFRVIPRSIVDSSQELTKATKTELFNIIVPVLQFPPELYAKPMNQILKIHEEDPKDWLPDTWIEAIEAPPQEEEKPPLFVKPGEQTAPAVPPGMPGAGMLPLTPPPVPGQSMQNQTGAAPGGGAGTVVPPGQVSKPMGPQLTGGNIFNKRI